jgi:hypothetical protein
MEQRSEVMDYFVVPAAGPTSAALEVQRSQTTNVVVTNVEPLYRSTGRQGIRKGQPLWKVYFKWVEA